MCKTLHFAEKQKQEPENTMQHHDNTFALCVSPICHRGDTEGKGAAPK